MVYLSEESNSRQEEDLNLPDTPAEKGICTVTLLSSAAFFAACTYYLLTPPDDGFKFTLTMVTGGVFATAMLVFFAALFTGKLCGCKKK